MYGDFKVSFNYLLFSEDVTILIDVEGVEPRNVKRTTSAACVISVALSLHDDCDNCLFLDPCKMTIYNHT